ncbi:bacillithiol biosynthesis cysteine-adding enzyme BshC [Paenibacillus brasilensis]|uniref:Putative cysteine ligase BshC n=1 Tax=Paenibacillus brasilensis TaxID=128574 RepID=A0ABU0KUF5_9BACL|nr:bacillithiol biosynthesis cysteine-adding enzyme BshC [Paenibacillus brasilensis]MDQ0493069.1 bacillithiol biosynthesis cysteine-adding enzyme BshC [Paenibacillus brasilensis]
MKIIPETLRGGSALAEDYTQGTGRARDLYEYDVLHADAYAQRAKWLDETEHLRLSRKEVVACLRIYNEQYNSYEAVQASLDRLENPDALVVVGGQQSGLFTGPMLVIYKAVTIIKAAREAEEKLGRPVIPVFWVAGEDHDWDEVNHTYVLANDPQAVKIKLKKQPVRRSSVSDIKVDAVEWKQVMADIEQNLPDSEHKADILRMIEHGLTDSYGLSEAFAKLLGLLFGHYGLVLLDSADPSLRKLEASVFRRLVQHNDELEQAYQTAAARIVDYGYHLQADVHEDGANLFYIHEDERLLLFKQGGLFTDRRGLVAFTMEELLEEIELHSERFSNNVLTRPLMQDSLFPVLASVLGLGEIAYWAITRDAFGVLEMQMPILLPRMSFTLVEPGVEKYMVKHELSFGQVRDGLEEPKKQWLAAQDQLGIQDQFSGVKEAFARLYEPLVQQTGLIEKGLLRLGETNSKKILGQIAYLETKVQEALLRQNETALRQWDRIEWSLFPFGQPQERVYTVYHFLNRHGLSLIDTIMNIPTDLKGTHRVIYL